jgi:hypothetical protein
MRPTTIPGLFADYTVQRLDLPALKADLLPRKMRRITRRQNSCMASQPNRKLYALIIGIGYAKSRGDYTQLGLSHQNAHQFGDYLEREGIQLSLLSLRWADPASFDRIVP